MTFKELKENLDIKNCYKAGRFLKTHTYKGHLTAKVFFDFQEMKQESILVNINGFLIPFFIDFQQSNCDIDPVIIKLKDINDIEQAKKLTSKDFFVHRNKISDIDKFLTDFENFVVGYKIINNIDNFSGEITDFYDGKIPCLL